MSNLFTQFTAPLIEAQNKVNVYLVNGVKIVGHIKSGDESGIIVTNGENEQFIRSNAISTISVAK